MWTSGHAPTTGNELSADMLAKRGSTAHLKRAVSMSACVLTSRIKAWPHLQRHNALVKAIAQ